jgi:hypothetical protein
MKDDGFEWDDAKAAKNLRDHKITFEMARDVFSDPFIVEWIDDGQTETEQRFAALGIVACCYPDFSYGMPAKPPNSAAFSNENAMASPPGRPCDSAISGLSTSRSEWIWLHSTGPK